MLIDTVYVYLSARCIKLCLHKKVKMFTRIFSSRILLACVCMVIFNESKSLLNYTQLHIHILALTGGRDAPELFLFAGQDVIIAQH